MQILLLWNIIDKRLDKIITLLISEIHIELLQLLEYIRTITTIYNVSKIRVLINNPTGSFN